MREIRIFPTRQEYAHYVFTGDQWGQALDYGSCVRSQKKAVQPVTVPMCRGSRVSVRVSTLHTGVIGERRRTNTVALIVRDAASATLQTKPIALPRSLGGDIRCEQHPRPIARNDRAPSLRVTRHRDRLNPRVTRRPAAYPGRTRHRIHDMLHEPRQDIRVTPRGLSSSWTDAGEATLARGENDRSGC